MANNLIARYLQMYFDTFYEYIYMYMYVNKLKKPNGICIFVNQSNVSVLFKFIYSMKRS